MTARLWVSRAAHVLAWLAMLWAGSHLVVLLAGLAP